MKTVAWKKMVTQLIAALGVMVLITQTGIVDGWISPNIARLTKANATIPLSLSQASWLASYHKLGKVASVILVPILIEVVGSKNSILYAFIPVSVAWLLTMTATSVTWLYLARFFSGITSNLSFSCFPIYLSEITSPSSRGTYLAIASLGWPLGTVIVSIAESYLSMSVSSVIYLLPCILGIFLFMWLPESPYLLVKYQNKERALQSLAWYRSHNNNDVEMNEIIQFVQSTSELTLGERMRQFRSRPILKSLILVVLVFALPHLCGILNIFYYMQILLNKGESHLVDSNQISIYVNVIMLVSHAVTINFVDKLGRRVLLIASSAVIMIALIGLGLHYYLLYTIKVDPVSLQWLPIAFIIILLVAFSIGSCPIMDVLLGELFTGSIKSTAVTVVSLLTALISFISTKAYQPLIDAIGEAYVFWMYATFVALMIPLFVLFLPETKGKSLQEIQNILLNKSSSVSSSIL